MLFLWGLALTMIKSAILLKLVTLKVWFAGFDSEWERKQRRHVFGPIASWFVLIYDRWLTQTDSKH